MKITRLKRGYRIRLSDAEFAALSDVQIRGEGEYEGLEEWELDEISPQIRRGLKTITGAGSWAVEGETRQSGAKRIAQKEGS